MKSITLEVLPRTEVGTTASTILRRNEQVPCVLYGKDKHLHFTADYNKLRKVIFTPEFLTIKISCNGETYDTIIKEIQYHPVSDKMLHVDFLYLQPGKKVIANVPVKFVGIATGVKDGGMLYTKVRLLRISALPEHLIDEIQINVEHIALGKQMRVKDLKIENITISEMPEKPLCAVYIPRVLKIEEEVKPVVAAEAAAPAAGAAAKPGEAAKGDAAKPDAKGGDKKGGDKGKK